MRALIPWNPADTERRLHGLWIYVILPVCGLTAVLLAATRGYLILKYAVDIPFWDEWDMLAGFDGWKWSWIVSLHNEHRIVTTRLVEWMLYAWGGWNLIAGLWVNYASYLLIPALLLGIALRDSKSRFLALVPFLIFFFSNASSDNDAVGFQIQWRFFIVFLLLGALLLFEERQRLWAILAGAFALLLSMYSLASGIPASLTLIGVFAGFKVARLRAGAASRHELQGLSLAGLVVAAGAAAWFLGWRKNPGHPPLVTPTDPLFWEHYLNQISLAAGHNPVSPLTGAAILSVSIVVMAADGWKHRQRPVAGSWRRIGIGMACLASLASISMARAGFGAAQSGSSRYFEVALLILPVAVLCGHAALSQTARRWYLAAVFLVCCLGYSQRWSESPYRLHGAALAAGVECLQRNLKQGRPLDCISLYPAPLDGYVEHARRLNLSFYRKHLANLR